MLSYAQQVAELEKIRRLESWPPREGPLPDLVNSPGLRCLVCAREGRSCAGCGCVGYCGVEHQLQDAPFHARVCRSLADAAQDERSRASANEWLYREVLSESALGSTRLTGWDDYLGTQALSGSKRRLLTDSASRPLTIGWLVQRLDSSDASRASLDIHVMAASRRELESCEAYMLLSRLWPETRWRIVFVGPELPDCAITAQGKIEFAAAPGAEYHLELWPEFGRPDLIVGFNAGLLLYRSWERTIMELIGSGVPWAITSYRAWEAGAEAQVLSGVGAANVMAHRPNPFASQSPRRSSTLANDVSFDNAHVSVWR
jgi:hypothetical protein